MLITFLLVGLLFGLGPKLHIIVGPPHPPSFFTL